MDFAVLLVHRVKKRKPKNRQYLDLARALKIWNMLVLLIVPVVSTLGTIQNHWKRDWNSRIYEEESSISKI